MELLRVENLHTSFFTPAGEVKAVNGISFSLDSGKVLGIVGESGSGKSVSAYSVMQILSNPGQIVDGSIKFKGEELVGYHYETCFADIPAQQGFEHKIVAWEDVAADEGTGVVHIAPGCGAEDNELGKRLGLTEIMPVDDMGIFLKGFGFFFLVFLYLF